MTISDYFIRIQDFFNIISHETFGGILGPILIGITGLVILAIAINKTKLKFNINVIFLFFIIIGVFFVTARITPFYMYYGMIGRYLSGIYPIIVLLFSWLLCYICYSIKIAKMRIILPKVMILCVLLIFLNVNLRSQTVYLFHREPDMEAKFAHYEDSNLILIVPSFIPLYIESPNFYFDFMSLDNIYIMTAFNAPWVHDKAWDDAFQQAQIGSTEAHINNLFIALYYYGCQDTNSLALEEIKSIYGDFELELYVTLRQWWSIQLSIYRVIWQTEGGLHYEY